MPGLCLYAKVLLLNAVFTTTYPPKMSLHTDPACTCKQWENTPIPEGWQAIQETLPKDTNPPLDYRLFTAEQSKKQLASDHSNENKSLCLHKWI